MIKFTQTEDIHQYKNVLEGLTDEFDQQHYSAILTWCNVIDGKKDEWFWEVWLITDHSEEQQKDVVIGMCGLYSITGDNNTNELWLGWFGIIPEYRNKGIGTHVLDFLKVTAKIYNCKTIYSYVDKNGKPLDFYYRNEFQLVGTVREYIKDKPEIVFEDCFSDLNDFVIKHDLP